MNLWGFHFFLLNGHCFSPWLFFLSRDYLLGWTSHSHLLGVCLQRPPLFEPAVEPPAIRWLALPSRNACGDRVSSREGPLELRITSGRLRNSASYSGVADSVGLAAASRYTSPPSRSECWAPSAVSSSPAIE